MEFITKTLYLAKMFFMIIYPIFLSGKTEITKDGEHVSATKYLTLYYLLYLCIVITEIT